MKVIHVPFCFYPDSVGGTEIYVAGLAREQQRVGHSVVVCAPATHNSTYTYDGLPVRRFALDPKVIDVADLYGPGDARAAVEFGQILEQEQPEVVHLHAFTRGSSLRLIREAKRRGIVVVFSYHTPTVSCMRGTLLRRGVDVCDGALNTRACASCILGSLGVSRPIGDLLGSLPIFTGRVIGRVSPRGKISTAVRMRALAEDRHDTFRSLMREVDRVVALSNWTRELLLTNGVPAAKISLSRQGLDAERFLVPANRVQSKDLRVAWLGRFAPEKGLHVLIAALRQIPEARIKLDIYGVCQSHSDANYEKRISKLVGRDARVSFLPPLLRPAVVPTLQNYDLLAVPSQWMETGPMVVMEAFAARVPVIGSRLGGIAELVKHGINGLLVEPRSLANWAHSLLRLSENRDFLSRLEEGIEEPRTMREAACEISGIYSRLLPAAQTSVLASEKTLEYA